MPDSLTSKERPQFVPAVRKPKLPYLCAGAECVTCKRPVSGDWGLVPDECETCDAERQARYYRSVAQWAEEEVSRLKAMLAARTPQEATGIYESAWVIEGMWSSAAYPEYWVGSSAWSSDPYKALRFASKESAQQAADMMLVGINHRVACHEFAGDSHHE